MKDDSPRTNPNIDDSSANPDARSDATSGNDLGQIGPRCRGSGLVIILSLVVFYPLGLWLLIRSRRIGRIKRVVVALLTLPAFFLLWIIILKPYIAFDGGMQSPSLDFRKGGGQASVVAAHRQQSNENSEDLNPDESPFANLWYPAFRGPNRDGVIPGEHIALDWTKHPPRELWRIPVGDGWASMSVGYGRLITIDQRGDDEAVACYDAETGTELWTYSYRARFVEALGGDGPRSTPTIHEGRIYALGAEGHFHCLDARTGQLYWKAQINRDFDADNLWWAMSASPLIFEDTVIVTNSGKGGGSIIAYRLADGSVAWTSDVGQQSYSSPVVATVAGREQLLNLAARLLNGIDPRDGAKLWSFPFETPQEISVAQPLVIGDDRIFISAGYGVGCAMLKIEPRDDTLIPKTLWSNNHMKNKFSSSVYHDGFLYGLDERILACIDAETGERQWKGGRYNYGSVLLVQDHLLVLSEDGELVLVKASPESHQEIGRVQILNDMTWNNHSLVGGVLFARNHRQMVCYDLRKVANDGAASE